LNAIGVARKRVFEDWAVEALADVRAGGDHQQRRPVRLGPQAGEGGCACFGAHAALQDHRIMATIAQRAGELIEVTGPLGQHQAVPATGECLSDITYLLGGPGLVGGQVLVNGCDTARGGGVGFTDVRELGVVHAEHGDWALRRLTQVDAEVGLFWAVRCRSVLARARGVNDRVPGGADLEGDEIVELVAPVGGWRSGRASAGPGSA